MSTKTKVALVSTAVVAALVTTTVVMMWREPDRGTLSNASVDDAVDAGTLTEVSNARVFFGHQSVGANLVDGIPLAYQAKDLAPPQVVQVASGEAPTSLPSGGAFVHSYVGHNGDPEGKLEAFDSMLRSGLADEVDVAMLKLCYVDIVDGTDVDALFRQYQTTLAALQRDYPDVTFIHVTTPLTTAPSLKSRVKSIVRGGYSPVAADNIAREQYNELMRQEYADGQVFDLAALESTAPDGSRLSGSYEGEDYFTLYGGYSADSGHLNQLASQFAASQLLTYINASLA